MNQDFTPTFAEVCVKAVLINAKNEVLLLQRHPDSIGGGSWDLPGGMLEEGEKPEDGLRREIQEETGIEVATLAPIYTDGAIPHKVGHYTVWIWFKGVYEHGNIELDQENTAFTWVSLDAATNLIDDELPKAHRLAIIAAKSN